MNNAVCSIVSYALNGAWQIPLIAGAGWIAGKAIRRWGAQPQHVVWTTTWLLSIFTPILPLFRNIAGLSGRSAGTAHVSIALSGSGPVGGARAGLLLPPWLMWLVFAAYACTLVYFAARLLWLLAGARSLVHASNPVKWGPGAEAAWRRARGAFAADAAILSSPKVRGVMTIGARRPAIILPPGFAERSI